MQDNKILTGKEKTLTLRTSLQFLKKFSKEEALDLLTQLSRNYINIIN